jgi:hypothetical protein
MRESRTYGFVRGAHSDMRPYRDLHLDLLSPVVFRGRYILQCLKLMRRSGAHSIEARPEEQTRFNARLEQRMEPAPRGQTPIVRIADYSSMCFRSVAVEYLSGKGMFNQLNQRSGRKVFYFRRLGSLLLRLSASLSAQEVSKRSRTDL